MSSKDKVGVRSRSHPDSKRRIMLNKRPRAKIIDIGFFIVRSEICGIWKMFFILCTVNGNVIVSNIVWTMRKFIPVSWLFRERKKEMLVM